MPSQIETAIGRLIQQQFPFQEIQRNIRPEWLVTEQNERLELDFYLPELELAFEVQGEQHYHYIPYFHREPGDFEKQIARDKAKRRICAANNVCLIEVASREDYKAVQSDILAALERNKEIRLRNYLLKRCSQTILNIINLTIKLERKRQDLLQYPSHKKVIMLGKVIYDLESNRELLRYVSVRAIQDFHGLVPFLRLSRVESFHKLRSQGRFPSKRRSGPSRKGSWGNMKQWA